MAWSYQQICCWLHWELYFTRNISHYVIFLFQMTSFKIAAEIFRYFTVLWGITRTLANVLWSSPRKFEGRRLGKSFRHAFMSWIIQCNEPYLNLEPGAQFINDLALLIKFDWFFLPFRPCWSEKWGGGGKLSEVLIAGMTVSTHVTSR